MKQLIFGVVLLLVLVITVLMIDFFRKSKVEFTFVKSIKVIGLQNEDIPLIISSEKTYLEKYLSQYLSPNEINNLHLENLDFKNLDYLVSFNRYVERIYFSKYYNSKYDLCRYTKEKPVQIIFKDNKYISRIFIYSIPAKNKYRQLCP
jgi:hypothetical protein